MSRDEIVASTYEAGRRLNRLKVEFGLIDRKTSESVEKRIDAAVQIMKKIDQAVAQSGVDEKEIDWGCALQGRLSLETYSMSTVCGKKELEWPTRFLRMNLFKNYAPKDGYTPLVKPGKDGIEFLEVGVLRLGPGGTYRSASDTSEVAIVFLGGLVNVTVGETEFMSIGGRAHIFAGRARTTEARLQVELAQLKEMKAEVVSSGLQELKNRLHLPRIPQRIECYDVSNTQGTLAVASMVVLEKGWPKPAHYRRFRIKTVSSADDYAMMYEVSVAGL
jgi:hypothetical protein